MNGHTPDVIAWTRSDDDLQGWLNPAHTRRGHDMPNINAMTASTYLKQHDVTPPKIVTIARLETANLARDDQPKKIRWVLFFEELDKGLVLNKTNIKRCAKACGDAEGPAEDTDQWLGKKIKLYFDEEVEFGGEQVGGIRITAAKPNGRPPPKSDVDDFDDAPPF